MGERTTWNRFWEKVDASGDCWEWTAYQMPSGYGMFRPGGSRNQQMAHRFSWELLVGPIPDGYEVDHRCKNRGCVNPDHLQPVPPKVNLMRSEAWSARNARKTRCPAGHAYDKANTRWYRGKRHCRACDRARPRREFASC
jgi:hypothetical protein